VLLESDNYQLTLTTAGCHTRYVTHSPTHQKTIDRIKDVRAQAIEHTRQARKLALERRDLMQSLIDQGWSQSDIARELGVSRQAIQKMMTVVPS
jgi:DNA-binding NarL/FixJ family response regulator